MEEGCFSKDDPLIDFENLSSLEDFSYDSSIQEEEEEEELQSPLEYAQMLESIHERLKEMYKSFPPFPNTNELAQISFLVLYSAQFVILYDLLDGKQSKPSAQDTQEQLYEKATFIHLRSLQERFFYICRELAAEFYVNLERVIRERGGDDHPLLDALEYLNEHVEMHSRRTKTDPTSQRNPKDFEKGHKPVINIVDGSEYQAKPAKVVEVVDQQVITEKKAYNRDDCCNWRWLTLHPLPSDQDYRKIDPMEGDEGHRIMVQVEQIQGNFECEEPLGFIVSCQWDKLLRLLHTMLHMEEYFVTYMTGAVKDEEYEAMKDMPWQDAWLLLTGKQFHNKPVEKYSREKHKVPMVVSRVAEFRDLMREAVQIISTLTDC